MKAIVYLGIITSVSFAAPAKFDLRDVNGKKFVSAVKSQQGGTCWTHGTMASVESNLLMTQVWAESGEMGESNLAEYHLDWWNGFNQHHNADTSDKHGLTVHQGGDYRVSSAYLTRGGGPVREADGQSYSSPPKQTDPKFKYFYARDIEWFSVGENLENIDRIKEAIQNHGAIGTALAWSDSFYSGNNFYQPKTSSMEANHAVAIIGWDDERKTQAPKPGAWLVKNSWGTGWGSQGYFWISYYDKVAGRHDQMGAVSYQNVEILKYTNVYSYDYHGWRDTKKDVAEAFNAFTAKGNANGRETLKSVGFYTAANDVEYTINVYSKFDGSSLSNLVSGQAGVAKNMGYHTVDLKWPMQLNAGDKFYVQVILSEGGHAYDKTSNVPVLLGSSGRVTVKSSAKAGESFYSKNGAYVDLTKDDATANFCIKALSVNE